jgi:hypothetical protein
MIVERWPRTLTFQKDDVQFTFDSEAKFAEWIGAEQNAWASLVPISMRQVPINQNQNLLDSLGPDKSDSNLRHAEEAYWPAQGNLGRFAIGIPNFQIRNFLVSEVIQSGSVPQQNHPDLIMARTLAYFYLAIGNNLTNANRASELAPKLKDAVDGVERIRETDSDCVARFNDLIQKSEADWKNRIEVFETKVALKAPKTFWKARASEHRSEAERNRKQWFWSMVIFVVIVAAAFVFNFIFPPSSSISSVITAELQRFIVFATLMAIGVWWLRQKLRDLRMHEHFAEDADERATMVETYAALRATGLQDANLEPVLTALYRPAMSAFREDLGPSLPADTLIRALGNLARSKGSN